MLAAEPNAGHRAIAELERDFEVEVLTQNVDNLHERAGSSRVTHLHGELIRLRSSRDSGLIVPIGLTLKSLCGKSAVSERHYWRAKSG